ncbi:MAG: polysaccharide deacetylase family protein [Actinobacteria bacterium]|nr:polysaccharide deacetylase family protein [Actinomycetota bacterium]MBU1942608.1 polysaccharide deacetylase family protein [Actinomycetota bacterium]MBU2688716.1 polysaccharide deacetylase family protein [Actinomycetota bacterium]
MKSTRGPLGPSRGKALLSVTMAVLLLSLVVALSPGCGSKNASVPTLDPFKGLDSGLASASGLSSGGFVVDGCLFTTRQGDELEGVLPPVKPQVLSKGNTNVKKVALTIDDGWNADMRILQLLKDSKVKFTAFLIGGRNMVESNPDFVRQIQEAGGEVCSHTWDHYVMRGKDEATVMMEIWKSQGIITDITHRVLPYIRFSGGAYDQPALDWTAREGYWVVNWSASDNDTASGVTVDSQVAALLSGCSNGAILLCHWGGHNTYEVLARAIPEIQKRGFEVTSLSEVMEGTPYVLTEKAYREHNKKK